MLDLSIVIAYLLTILVVGLLYRKRMVKLRDFSQSVGKLKHSKLLLVATLFASAVGGGTTFGMTEKVFSNNLALVYGMLLTVPIDILIGIYIVPLLSKFAGITSIGDIMQQYYGNHGKFLTGVSALITSLGYLAAQISISGKIFQYLLNITALQGIIISYIIVISYTALGGLRSVMVTNLLQFIAMLIAIPIISIIGINTIGFENFIQNARVEQYSLFASSILVQDTISAALAFAVMGIPPTFIQRILINKNSTVATSAVIYKSIIYFFFIALIGVNGMIASQLISPSEHVLVVPILIDQIIPTGIKGVVIIGLLASVMSTADSDLNVASTSIVNDIIKVINPNFTHHDSLLLAQILTAFIGVLAIILALYFNNVVDLVIFIASFWVPTIIVPMLFAAIGRTISNAGFLFSSGVTVATLCLWHIYLDQYYIKAVFASTITHIIIFHILWVIQKEKQGIKKY